VSSQTPFKNISDLREDFKNLSIKNNRINRKIEKNKKLNFIINSPDVSL
jgi:hypothetical protein